MTIFVGLCKALAVARSLDPRVILNATQVRWKGCLEKS